MAYGREKYVGRESFGDAIAPPEAVQARFSQKDGVILATLRFAEPGVHVAAKVANVEIGANVTKLRLAAEAAGANARPLTKIGERGAAGGNKAVAHVFAAEDSGKLQRGRDFGGDVFDTVDGYVDRFVH